MVLCFGLALPHVLSCAMVQVFQSVGSHIERSLFKSRSGNLCCALGQHISLTVPLPTQRNMGTEKLLGSGIEEVTCDESKCHSGDSYIPSRFMQQNPRELGASIDESEGSFDHL